MSNGDSGGSAVAYDMEFADDVAEVAAAGAKTANTFAATRLRAAIGEGNGPEIALMRHVDRTESKSSADVDGAAVAASCRHEIDGGVAFEYFIETMSQDSVSNSASNPRGCSRRRILDVVRFGRSKDPAKM